MNPLRLLAVCFVYLFATNCLAQEVDVRGSASVTYRDKVTPEAKNIAIEKARMKAVESFFAQGGEAETENFDRNAAAIEKNIEQFTNDPVLLNELDDPTTKRYSVSVRVRLNVARLRNLIKRSATVAASTTDKSKIIFVFVGREIASVQSFDERVVKQSAGSTASDVRNSSSKQGKDSESVSVSSAATAASKSSRTQASSEVSARVETGGSITRRADQVSRVVFETTDLNVSIKSAFSSAGFDVSDADFVLSSALISTINKEFTGGNKLAPESLKAVATAMQQSGVPLFVIATLDVGRQDADPATGLARHTVAVTGEVYNLSSWPPKSVAGVPPLQIVGVGPDPEAAKRQALRKASLDASREIISRLNAAGIR